MDCIIPYVQNTIVDYKPKTISIACDVLRFVVRIVVKYTGNRYLKKKDKQSTNHTPASTIIPKFCTNPGFRESTVGIFCNFTALKWYYMMEK